MLKRFVMIGLLGISIIGMLRTAEAHWIPTLSGWAWHSIRCTVELKQVPKLKAVTECEVTTATVESLCVNKGGNIQPQGESQAPVVGVGKTSNKNFVVKDQNTAIVHVVVGTPDGKPNDPPLDPSFCANPNWTNVANLIRSFHSAIITYRCLDDDCEDTLEVSRVETGEPCTLDAQYSLDGFDIGTDPFKPDDGEDCPNCPPPGTAYVCPNPVLIHVN